jgi:hypothetical protein
MSFLESDEKKELKSMDGGEAAPRFFALKYRDTSRGKVFLSEKKNIKKIRKIDIKKKKNVYTRDVEPQHTAPQLPPNTPTPERTPNICPKTPEELSGLGTTIGGTIRFLCLGRKLRSDVFRHNIAA